MSVKVSIILPNYNYARFLKERIRSILAQTFSNFELIIVDNGSTDESVAIIEQFADQPRIRTIIHSINAGVGLVYKRWNEAAAEATGDWLWFPNADDGATPHFLERSLNLAQRYPSSGLVYSRPMFINETGRIISAHNHIWYNNALDRLSGDYFGQGPEEVVNHSKHCYLWSASSLLIRRDAFNEVGGFDVKLRSVGDWDLYLKILHRYDLTYTAEPLAYVRIHGTSASTVASNIITTIGDACCIARAYKAMKDDPRYPAEAKAIVLRRLKSLVFDLFVAGPVEIPEDMRFAAQEVYEMIPDKRLR